MSKIKDAVLRAEEIREYYHWNFMEHLYNEVLKQPELSEVEIDDMEREHSSSLPSSNINISKQSLNNTNYNKEKWSQHAN